MRLVIQCALLWAMMCVCVRPAMADEQTLSIAPQNAADAAKTLARAFERAVLFQSDDVATVTSNAVQGRYSLPDALEEMFAGTRLQGGLTRRGVITISARAEPELSGEQPMRRSRFLLTSALTTLVATAAIGQDTPPAQENPETIIVVGSQIRGANVAGALPVTVLEEAAIELTGSVSGEELFSSIPQVGNVLFNGSRFVGVNGARGDVSSINLRGIGTGNTLVLLNGRRMVLHPGTQVENLVPVNSVNTNAIPVTGVRRVEVLRDGAAALYGADAV
ncbi:MAG: TonB-dependent receptor, partial [Caulobacterales bacterium]|nr:TonB-dependent receptor [Caulobacterales bacterium]